jgi:hypothetical protein
MPGGGRRLAALAAAGALVVLPGCARERSTRPGDPHPPSDTYVLPPSDTTLPPEVRHFLARQPIDEPVPAYAVLRLPADSLVLFRVLESSDFAPVRVLAGTYGLWYRGRVGWLPSEVPGLPPPVRALVFRIGPGDDLLLSPRLADTLREEVPDVWRGIWAPMIARHPETPVPTLMRAAEAGRSVRDTVLSQPRLRTDPDLLLRFAEGAGDEAWRDTFFHAVQRAGGPRKVSDEVLRRLVEVLPADGRHETLAREVAADPRVRASDSLLFALVKANPQQYPAVSRVAMDVLLSRAPLPDSLLIVLDWWTVRPELVNDRRVRGSAAVLQRLWWQRAPEGSALRATAARLLLRNGSTEPETVFEIAAAAAGNERRCRPGPLPGRELALLALEHPRARVDARIAQAVVYMEDARVHSRAVELLTGKPAPPTTPAQAAARRRMRAEAAHRTANTLAVGHLMRSEGAFVDSARAVLDRWANLRPPPPELAGWRRVLAETPNADSLAARLTSRDTLMARLHRRSPFDELLDPEEREVLAGVDCDRGNP